MTEKIEPNSPDNPQKPEPNGKSGEIAPPSKGTIEEIPPQVRRYLEEEGVDLNNPEVSKIVIQAEKTSVFSGPLPSPEVLAEYEKAHPGLADKIVSMTEKQLDHRSVIERKAVDGETQKISTGQLTAGGVAVFGLAMAAVVGVFGDPAASAVIAAVAVGAPTTAFVIRIFRAED